MATRSAGFASRYRVRKEDSGSPCVRLSPPRPAIRNLRPTDGIASKTVTFAPPCASTSAAINPAGPAPMMATSIGIEDMMLAHTGKKLVMPGLDPGIQVFLAVAFVDGRVKPGQDDRGRGAAGPRLLQLHTRPRRGLAHIFIRLLECILQRLRRRHIPDLGKMRRDRLWRPVGWRQVDALGLHDLDHRERPCARAHDGAGRRI